MPNAPHLSGHPTTPHSPVLIDFRKWDGREHWQEPTEFLGEDEYGVWLGMRVGTRFQRPGRAVVARADSVKLATDQGWFATFNGPGHDITTYVDIASVGVWSSTPAGSAFTLVDLDLDVVRRRNGAIYVDDRDEFEDHQRLFGYPDDVIRQAEQDCAFVLRSVQRRIEPFAVRPDYWMNQLLRRTAP